MTQNARTYPPGTIIVQDRVTLTKDNIGTIVARWPFHWDLYSWNYGPLDYSASYPQGRAHFFDFETVLGAIGWVRLFNPFATMLWSTSSGLGTTALAAHLKTLDIFYARGIKCMWIMSVVNDIAAWAISKAYNENSSIVKNGANYYRCMTSGTSAGAGGPTGTGSGIADGSCTWDYVGTEAVNAWGDSIISGTTHEQRVKDFLVALLTSGLKSPLGYTLANHPGLSAIEMSNEMATTDAAAIARTMRIVRKTFEQYRTQPTVYLGPNLEGSNRATPVRDWISASAVSLGGISAGSPADDGTGKIGLDYFDIWSQHDYSSIDTKTAVAAAGNSVSNTQQGVRYGAALAHTLMTYWYGPSAAAGGKWHNSVSPYFPPVWMTEGDISGSEVAEASDGFMWGQLSPDARKALFLRWALPALFSTHNGAGGVGTWIYYSIPATRQDTTTTLTGANATVGSGGKARVVLDSCGSQGAANYDKIVIYGGAAGWPELGVPAGGYKSFIGELVSGTTFDLQGTSIGGTTSAPSGYVVYHTRWMYVDWDTFAWFSELVRSGLVTFGYVNHGKASPTDAVNLGIMLHVEGRRPYYTDASGVLLRW